MALACGAAVPCSSESISAISSVARWKLRRMRGMFSSLKLEVVVAPPSFEDLAEPLVAAVAVEASDEKDEELTGLDEGKLARLECALFLSPHLASLLASLKLVSDRCHRPIFR